MLKRLTAKQRNGLLVIAAVVVVLCILGAVIGSWFGGLLLAGAILVVLAAQVRFFASSRRELEAAGNEMKILQFRTDAAAVALARRPAAGSLNQLDSDRVITIIGRGHSGTRAISETLHASKVDMGMPLNPASDLAPRGFVVDACRMVSRHVRYLGNLQWDYSQLQTAPIDPGFKPLLEVYLWSLFVSDSPYRGWKLPETTLIYPWLVRCLPEIKYIHWIRDPRDNILGAHMTDQLSEYGVECEAFGDPMTSRAASWKYHYDIVKATPRPKHYLEVKLEDFVLQQDQTLKRLQDFLGFALNKVPVRTDRIRLWQEDPRHKEVDFLQEALQELSYA